jgi:hypothetical protein
MPLITIATTHHHYNSPDPRVEALVRTVKYLVEKEKLMAKTITDLTASVTALGTALTSAEARVTTLEANAAPDLSDPVAQIDSLTDRVNALAPATDPTPTPAT